MAAAVRTPSGAPPVPITAWTPDPTTAAAMPADKSPSPISRMRAPVARMSAISLSWRGRSRTVTTRSSTDRPRQPDRPQVLVHRRVEADVVLRARADDQLVHVEIGGVQQPSRRRRGKDGDRVGRADRAQVRAFQRIDRDVDLRQRDGGAALERVGHAHLLADVQHRRRVALALADHDGAVDRHRIHRAAHRFDRGVVRAMAIALAHGVRAGNGGLFDDAQEFE